MRGRIGGTIEGRSKASGIVPSTLLAGLVASMGCSSRSVMTPGSTQTAADGAVTGPVGPLVLM